MNVLVVYATREGHTAAVATHIAERLRAGGHAADVEDAGRLELPLELSPYDAIILAASIHVGRHEPEMIRFIRQNRAALERVPSAFLSVSAAEATAEDLQARPEVRAEAQREVDASIAKLFADTGWHPTRVKAVAGALLWTRYGTIVRFLIRLIATKKGTRIDTTKDTDYTNYESLDHFVEAFLGLAGVGQPAVATPG